MDKSTPLKFVLFFIPTIWSLVESDMSDGFRCIYKIGHSDSGWDKSANVMQLVSWNIENIKPALRKSSRCLIRTSSKEEKLLNYLSSIKRHVVLLENMTCSAVPASNYQTEMYCTENEEIWEKYQVREKIVSRIVSTVVKNILYLSRGTLKRRSNLLETEFIVTSSKAAHRTRDLKYGNVTEAYISGMFGDFFMILSKTLNFTFSLVKPEDGKWGGRSEGRSLGWNGMVGDIAEGLVDFGIGPFTITAERSEVIQFSIGNLGYVKTFFFSTKTQKAFNYLLFFSPLGKDSWTSILLVILIASVALFLIMCLTSDKQSAEFTL